MFKPMLAVNLKPETMKFPLMGSLKLEGVRAEFTPDGLKTRPMKQFGNKGMEERFRQLSDYCIKYKIYVEGEFYRHGMNFNDISSICRRADHPDTDELVLYIFDLYIPSMPHLPFTDRYEAIIGLVERLDDYGRYVALEQHMMTNKEDVIDTYSQALDDGFEGYILKHPTDPYKLGRSTVNEQLFGRMKAQNTYDGVVLEIVERFENLCESEANELGYMSKRQDKDQKQGTGMAAVAIVKANDFDKEIRVTLSRGLTDADRANIWNEKDSYVGRNIQFVGIPVKGMLPRSPRFDVWRTDLD